jgi:hypothetical protein
MSKQNKVPNFKNRIPKKLNIKQSNHVNNTNITANTGNSLLDISMGAVNKTERAILDLDHSNNPVQKVVVIKKSKIRQFMKLKKKEK